MQWKAAGCLQPLPATCRISLCAVRCQLRARHLLLQPAAACLRLHFAALDEPAVRKPPPCAAEYRALLRMRRASTERYEDPAFQRFSRLLLKVRTGRAACALSASAAHQTCMRVPCCALVCTVPWYGLPKSPPRCWHIQVRPAVAPSRCVRLSTLSPFSGLAPWSPVVQLPEHTWGVDVKEFPNNWDIWANAGGQAAYACTPYNKHV